MSQPNSIEFATTPLLSTGVRLHYAERGDREGEAIIFLQGIRFVVLLQSGAPLALALLPRHRAHPARARGFGQARMLLHG